MSWIAVCGFEVERLPCRRSFQVWSSGREQQLIPGQVTADGSGSIGSHCGAAALECGGKYHAALLLFGVVESGVARWLPPHSRPALSRTHRTPQKAANSVALCLSRCGIDRLNRGMNPDQPLSMESGIRSENANKSLIEVDVMWSKVT